MNWRWMVCMLGLFAVRAMAQTQVEPLPLDRNLSALKAVAGPLDEALDEVEKLRAELKRADTDERKKELESRIEAERERIRQLRTNFRDIVGGAEAADEGIDEAGETDLKQQVNELLQPVLGELREATSSPREMEAMRKSLASWEERKERADRVLMRIQALLKKAELPRVKQELAAVERVWEGRQAEAAGQMEVLAVRIEERERQTPTLWQAISRLFGGFWKSRGLNLLIAVAVATAGFLLVRKIYHRLRRIGVIHRRTNGTLTGRISDLLAMIVAILVAVSAVLLVFYLRGDWLLMTVAVIFLIGVVWASKTALPPYIDQIRMLLNLGSVREGERLIYQGLPWRVRSLGFFTVFVNPALSGGELRIPLKDVMGMISREADPKEPWFPSQADDWVVLADETFGKVIQQSPEQVVVLRLGGSLKTYPTTEFLEQIPENLSRGFRLGVTFGIDYKHQPIATGEVPSVFEDALRETLVGEFGREGVKSVKVEFEAAGASSLDFAVLADFDGNLAPRYRFLRRMIQRVCVDVCTEYGWEIPFTQITVHQAKGEG